MSELRPGDIRYALEVARKNGYRQVALRSGDVRFRAVLGSVTAPRAVPSLAVVSQGEVTDSGGIQDVTAPAVGYFREREAKLEIGRVVEAGDVIGEVVALGIANEVLVGVGGRVCEVCVSSGDAVEFGQVLARLGA